MQQTVVNQKAERHWQQRGFWDTFRNPLVVKEIKYRFYVDSIASTFVIVVGYKLFNLVLLVLNVHISSINGTIVM